MRAAGRLLPDDGAGAPQRAGSSVYARPRTVLLADDDVAFRTTLAKVLTLHGYEVRVAENGADLMFWYCVAPSDRRSRGPADVIVTDVDMPGCDGFEALQALRAHQVDAPVIFISGHLDHARRELARALGATDVLLKPFDVRDLEASIARAIASR